MHVAGSERAMSGNVADGLALGTIRIRSWRTPRVAVESDWPNELLQPDLIKHRIDLGIPIGLG